MTDYAGFLQAIIAEPDDDTPRLVYADWLEEHGPSDRAEFIRIQCEMARLNKDDPRWPELDRRERVLRKAHFEEWINPLNAAARFYRTLSEFRRGFVEVIKINDEPFLAGGAKLLLMAPIRRLTIHTGPKSVVAVAKSSFGRVSQLYLVANDLAGEHVRAMATSPSIQQLRYFRLSGYSWAMQMDQRIQARGFQSQNLMPEVLDQWRTDLRAALRELRAVLGKRLDLADDLASLLNS